MMVTIAAVCGLLLMFTLVRSRLFWLVVVLVLGVIAAQV